MFGDCGVTIWGIKCFFGGERAKGADDCKGEGDGGGVPWEDAAANTCAELEGAGRAFTKYTGANACIHAFRCTHAFNRTGTR